MLTPHRLGPGTRPQTGRWQISCPVRTRFPVQRGKGARVLAEFSVEGVLIPPRRFHLRELITPKSRMDLVLREGAPWHLGLTLVPRFLRAWTVILTTPWVDG